MIKVSAQTFFTASRDKSEINMRISDLCCNVHTMIRFYQNNYTVRQRNKCFLKLKEFSCISQSFHSSLSYIIERSDFQAKRLKRDIYRAWLLTETALQYQINAIR